MKLTARCSVPSLALVVSTLMAPAVTCVATGVMSHMVDGTPGEGRR